MIDNVVAGWQEDLAARRKFRVEVECRRRGGHIFDAPGEQGAEAGGEEVAPIYHATTVTVPVGR